MASLTKAGYAGTSWTELEASGQFGIQMLGAYSLLMYIGDDVPEQNTEDAIILSTGAVSSFSVVLPDGYTVWVRATDRPVPFRFYSIPAE